LVFALPSASPSFTVLYQIDAKSRLFLNGSTNINTFQCFCKDQYQATTLSGTMNQKNGTIQFNKAQLLIRTELISCKNKLMNKDLHKALKSDDFPFIKMDLLEVIPQNNQTPLTQNTWYTYKASTNLTIAGITKPVTVSVQINKQSPHLFRLIASKEILMSDFQVKPRTPFNMIKIDDLIVINFDLLILVQATAQPS
jgi:polyisoprenoid-binding protein YceI